MAACACALMVCGAATAATPKPKSLPSCATFMPVAAANVATGNAYALTKTVQRRGPGYISCEYDNASWPGPQGTAGAVSVTVRVADAGARKFFATVMSTYAHSATVGAARPNCTQPGYQPAPLADTCQTLHPLGTSSIEFVGYLDVLTPKYLYLVSRGGADYTPEGLQALARAAMRKIH